MYCTISLSGESRRRIVAVACCCILLAVSGFVLFNRVRAVGVEEEENTFIKWVDFKVSYEAMDRALRLDMESHKKGGQINWVNLLAYAAAGNGGNFENFKLSQLDVRKRCLL